MGVPFAPPCMFFKVSRLRIGMGISTERFMIHSFNVIGVVRIVLCLCHSYCYEVRFEQ